MKVEESGLVQSVRARLLARATAIASDPNTVLARYGIERFLYRLSISPCADRFVLEGAMLLAAWLGQSARPTRDIDLLGLGRGRRRPATPPSIPCPRPSERAGPARA